VGSEYLAPLLDELDEEVAAAEGRVYLAKDARLSPERFRAMYPRVGEWLAVRQRVDPDGILRSDLGRRLDLSPDPKQPNVPPSRARRRTQATTKQAMAPANRRRAHIEAAPPPPPRSEGGRGPHHTAAGKSGP
jgi:hypothetical protein